MIGIGMASAAAVVLAALVVVVRRRRSVAQANQGVVEHPPIRANPCRRISLRLREHEADGERLTHVCHQHTLPLESAQGEARRGARDNASSCNGR